MRVRAWSARDQGAGVGHAWQAGFTPGAAGRCRRTAY